MWQKLSFVFICGILGITIWLSGCRRDESFFEGKVSLRFSSDTLRFDTVFTSRGSATRILKIFNPESAPVKVSLSLENGSLSPFNFNADGESGPDVDNLTIRPLDSIYVFVQVFIDPDEPLSSSPFIIEELLKVDVNGNMQYVLLEAWGQNANYIPARDAGGSVNLLSCRLNEISWDDPRPYVIYGILVVDSCTLVLPPGTKIYVHGGVVRNQQSVYNDGLIAVLKNGKIISKGTPQEQVVIQGDRLEEAYASASGQWVGILLSTESRGNQFEYTTVKNSLIGMRVDSLAQVKLLGCQIYSTGNSGLIGRHALIQATNCLIFDNGKHAVELAHGGSYQFTYCTFGSYFGQFEAVSVNDYFCYETPCQQLFVNNLNTEFVNCIIAGAGEEEILMDNKGQNNIFQYSFRNTLYKIKNLAGSPLYNNLLANSDDCIMLKGGEKLFADRREGNYQLDSLSVAIGKARAIPSIPNDILGKIRKSDNPDAGCFER
jgi:hypothetical protein